MREPGTCLVVIAVIGTPAPRLAAALDRFAARGVHLAREPDERLPARFRLAWIFVDEAALAGPEVRAWHARLAALAPVQLAVRAPPARHEALALSCIDLKDGAILQPYDDASFGQVSRLIEAFLARAD